MHVIEVYVKSQSKNGKVKVLFQMITQLKYFSLNETVINYYLNLELSKLYGKRYKVLYSGICSYYLIDALYSLAVITDGFVLL